MPNLWQFVIISWVTQQMQPHYLRGKHLKYWTYKYLKINAARDFELQKYIYFFKKHLKTFFEQIKAF